MGNNAVCGIKGIGTVKLSLHNGLTKTLTDVRYIPDLKRNLISLGTLDSIGLSYKASSGSLSVMKGSLIVMKGEKKNGLYVLKGRTDYGIAAVGSLVTQDKTSLWHQRLAHVSERRLDELSK